MITKKLFRKLFKKFLLHIVFSVIAALLIVFAADAQLPTPPSFGGTASKDFWDYFKNALIAILTVAAIALLIIAILGAGGGLLRALQEGRDHGESSLAPCRPSNISPRYNDEL